MQSIHHLGLQSAICAALLLGACRAPEDPSPPKTPAASPKTIPQAKVTHRPSNTLPQTTLPWLELRDHFVATVGEHSGKGKPMGPLMVLADATFAPGSRFPKHRHKEMEILSIVLDGQLSHHGDQAHGQTLGPRQAQLISARSGMAHAEGNDTDAPTRMLQIWIRPDRKGGQAAYFHRRWEPAPRVLVAGDDEMPLRADAKVWWLEVEQPQTLEVKPGRRGYLMALHGALNGPGGLKMTQGDGLEVDTGQVKISADSAAKALWIDVAMGQQPPTNNP